MSAQGKALPTNGANVIIISGVSGGGKGTTILKLQKRLGERVWFSVSVTTRAPRDGEVDGVDYHFRTKDEFERMIRQGMFAEWALVHGYYYGTPIIPIQEAAAQDRLIVLDIEVQGVREIKQKLPLACCIFLYATTEELRRRLVKRNKDSPEALEKRLSDAPGEIELARQVFEADHLIETITTFDASLDDTEEGVEKTVDIVLQRIETHAARHWT